METYIQSKGQYETNINGNVIDNSKWNVVYDGDIMNLEVNHNDEHLYMKLDNEDIMKLFELPSNNKTIEQRLHDTLNDVNNEDNLPLIIQHMKSTKPKKYSRKSKKSHSKNLSHKSHSKSHSKSPVKTPVKTPIKTRSKTHSKKSKRLSSHSKSKRTNKNMTPDYLKTIY